MGKWIFFAFVGLATAIGFAAYSDFRQQYTTIAVEITHETIGDTIFVSGMSGLAGKIVYMEQVGVAENPVMTWRLTDENGLVFFNNLPVPSQWKISVWDKESQRLLVTYKIGPDSY